mgnify:CR=1 FL=1
MLQKPPSREGGFFIGRIILKQPISPQRRLTLAGLPMNSPSMSQDNFIEAAKLKRFANVEIHAASLSSV